MEQSHYYRSFSSIAAQVQKCIITNPYLAPYEKKLEKLVFKIEPEKLLQEENIIKIKDFMDFLTGSSIKVFWSSNKDDIIKKFKIKALLS